MALKLYFNSVLPTPGSKYLAVNVENLYLINPMPNHEYYNISFSLIPQDIIYKYEIM